jgi:hypothetical protein
MPYDKIPVDWRGVTGDKGGYHPSRQAFTDRRERLKRAVSSLAETAFGGDVRAAAKRLAAHVGRIAAYQTYRAPETSSRMRANQRWIRDAYYPSRHSTLLRTQIPPQLLV